MLAEVMTRMVTFRLWSCLNLFSWILLLTVDLKTCPVLAAGQCTGQWRLYAGQTMTEGREQSSLESTQECLESCETSPGCASFCMDTARGCLHHSTPLHGELVQRPEARHYQFEMTCSNDADCLFISWGNYSLEQPPNTTMDAVSTDECLARCVESESCQLATFSANNSCFLSTDRDFLGRMHTGPKPTIYRVYQKHPDGCNHQVVQERMLLFDAMNTTSNESTTTVAAFTTGQTEENFTSMTTEGPLDDTTSNTTPDSQTTQDSEPISEKSGGINRDIILKVIIPVVGGVVVIAVIATVTTICVRKRRRVKKMREQSGPEDTSNDAQGSFRMRTSAELNGAEAFHQPLSYQASTASVDSVALYYSDVDKKEEPTKSSAPTQDVTSFSDLGNSTYANVSNVKAHTYGNVKRGGNANTPAATLSANSRQHDYEQEGYEAAAYVNNAITKANFYQGLKKGK